MRSLWELTGEWQYIFSMLEDEEVDADSIIDTCGLIEEEITEKADNYGKVIRMLELEAQDAKAEASRLAARAKVAENRAARLKASLFEALKATGQKNLKTKTFSFGINKTQPKVRIYDLDAALSSGYLKDIQPSEDLIDKAKMKYDMERGVAVPGAELVQGECLRMR